MTAATPMDIAAQIRPAMTKLYVTYFRMAEQSDLTGPQLTILTRLAEHGASRISEVARQEGIRMPTASNALHQLEHRGMVERIRDTSDRRGVRVQLTELGRTELKRVGDERTTYLAEMLSSLSPEKLEIAEQIVPVVTELAERYSANQKNA
ncbi:MarR family winged helix-turn-helix transcriptional regulator [Corynebacterium meridianum]|uniref:MarR family transcriptional regulator n=1 Tax=Corynebacterium meridianum TaxID=2765363 RepID=A0A934HZ98_9CORY|nr:MarR family transcriptional regulator [Corynebacterium meridianum]MBI8989683.1 MarR family transcriptional regulator [Corynebacterium meridianum]MCK7677907.1 MarR family transcriptional regulator [Corynebacterium meridianum]